MKIGIIREGKIPTDSRTPLSPIECAAAIQRFPVEIVVETCPTRCFSDDEFRSVGVPIVSDISDCDILLGVKEVPVQQLIPNKTYFFFSHTIKQQPQNRKLLWAILDKKIKLVDYEVLKENGVGERLIAFGRFAGMVGAHNALWTYGQRTGAFSLPRMKDCHDYAEAVRIYSTTKFPSIKIVLTGTGRVATGAAQVLADMGIQMVPPTDFLARHFDVPVFTQLACDSYVRRKDGGAFSKAEFYAQPSLYESAFEPYAAVSDVMINGIYWDSRSPAFFSISDMASPNFRIQVIADVTCDIAPVSSIPSTLRASTIAEPVFGFDPKTGLETTPHQKGCIDVMSIDNLPNEMPRDASSAFGNMFLEHILPEILKPKSVVIDGGTIADGGSLTERFHYLIDYAMHSQPVSEIA